MRINNVSSNNINNKSNTTQFKALKGVEYLGTFNPGVKPIDLEVLKAMQESKAINRFCQKYNVTIYLYKACSLGEYTSTLTFRYKNIAKNFKDKLKNMFTPKKELNLIYQSKEASAEHSQNFKKMIQDINYIDLEDMSRTAPDKIQHNLTI